MPRTSPLSRVHLDERKPRPDGFCLSSSFGRVLWSTEDVPVPCRHQSHCASEPEQVSTTAHPDFSSLPTTPRVPQHQSPLIVFNRVNRFFRREIGVVANRQSVRRDSRSAAKPTVPTRVEFLSLTQAQRFPPRQPEHLRSYQKIDTLVSNVHVCHRDLQLSFRREQSGRR